MVDQGRPSALGCAGKSDRLHVSLWIPECAVPARTLAGWPSPESARMYARFGASVDATWQGVEGSVYARRTPGARAGVAPRPGCHVVAYPWTADGSISHRDLSGG